MEKAVEPPTKSKESKRSFTVVTSPTDPIPSSLWPSLADELSPAIAGIFNTSFDKSIVPKSFKSAVVQPILTKSGLDSQVLANYRPVSLLPFLSKVLEKIVAKQLTAHIEKHNLSGRLQSGFRRRHSTETALLRVANDILSSNDSINVTALVLLDLSAAFDTVDHQILLDRLASRVGLAGETVAWFKSYLSERVQ